MCTVSWPRRSRRPTQLDEMDACIRLLLRDRVGMCAEDCAVSSAPALQDMDDRASVQVSGPSICWMRRISISLLHLPGFQRTLLLLSHYAST